MAGGGGWRFRLRLDSRQHAVSGTTRSLRSFPTPRRHIASATRCWHHVSIRAHDEQRAAYIAGALGRVNPHHNLIRGPRAGGPARRGL